MRLRRSVACLVLGAALCACRSTAPQPCTFDLSLTGFVQELLFPRATSRTAAFDAYTAGSYRVNKMGLIRGIEARRLARSPGITGTVIVGPFGPLWQYDVFLFVATGSDVQVNFLSMPHARITAKGTRRMTLTEFEDLRTKLLAHPALISVEAPSASAGEDRDGEWASGVAVAFWVPDMKVRRSSWSGGPVAMDESLQKLIDSASEHLIWTYATDLGDDEPIHRPCPPP